MEKSNVVKMEEIVPSFLSELTARSQASKISKILEAAKKRGRITTAEIAQLLPGSVMKDREMFSFFVAQLGEYLKRVNLGLSQKAEVIVLRKNEDEIDNPKPITLRSASRKVAGKNRGKIEVDVRPFGEEEWTDVDIPAFDEDAMDPSLSEIEQTELDKLYLSDSVAQYFQEFASLKLLTNKEVCELSRRIHDEKDLDARNKLVSHNLRLVVWMARRFDWSDIPLADLLQEGNLGLITAAERFDGTLGYSFATYAQWWIRQAISRAVMNQSGAMRIPVHLQGLRFKILQATEKLALGTGNIPSPKAIASYLHLPENKVESALKAMNLFFPHSLDEIVSSPRASNDGAETVSYKDMVPDVSAVDPLITIEAKEELVATYRNLQVILTAVEELPGDKKRNMSIFKEVHGLNEDGERKTLEEIGEAFGVTRERIRQILANIFLQLNYRGIAVDKDALKNYMWRIQELEKLVGCSPEL